MKHLVRMLVLAVATLAGAHASSPSRHDPVSSLSVLSDAKGQYYRNPQKIRHVDVLNVGRYSWRRNCTGRPGEIRASVGCWERGKGAEPDTVASIDCASYGFVPSATPSAAQTAWRDCMAAARALVTVRPKGGADAVSGNVLVFVHDNGGTVEVSTTLDSIYPGIYVDLTGTRIVSDDNTAPILVQDCTHCGLNGARVAYKVAPTADDTGANAIQLNYSATSYTTNNWIENGYGGIVQPAGIGPASFVGHTMIGDDTSAVYSTYIAHNYIASHIGFGMSFIPSHTGNTRISLADNHITGGLENGLQAWSSHIVSCGLNIEDSLATTIVLGGQNGTFREACELHMEYANYAGSGTVQVFRLSAYQTLHIAKLTWTNMKIHPTGGNVSLVGLDGDDAWADFDHVVDGASGCLGKPPACPYSTPRSNDITGTFYFANTNGESRRGSHASIYPYLDPEMLAGGFNCTPAGTSSDGLPLVMSCGTELQVVPATQVFGALDSYGDFTVHGGYLKRGQITYAALSAIPCDASHLGQSYWVTDGAAKGWSAAVTGGGGGVPATCNGTNWAAY